MLFKPFARDWRTRKHHISCVWKTEKRNTQKRTETDSNGKKTEEKQTDTDGNGENRQKQTETDRKETETDKKRTVYPSLAKFSQV